MDDWLPASPQTRKLFIAVVVLGCIVLGVVRFLLAPELVGSDPPGLGDVVDETLGNVIATALAATALAWLLLKLLPAPQRPAIVQSIPANEISQLLESALPSTKRWWFNGSTGRFQRATTLPEMGRLARREGTSREVKLMILDPLDDALCLRYANYRKGLLSGSGQPWTVESVRRDLYATLLAACTYREREPLVVTVGLRQTMSILRYDLSDTQLVITKEGRADPAICFPAESFYFDAYVEDLRHALEQARSVDMSGVTVPTGSFDKVSARAAFRAMGVYTSVLDQDDVIEAVIDEAASRNHPYR